MAFEYVPRRGLLRRYFSSTPWLDGYYGRRFVGAVGLAADAAFTALSNAARVGNITASVLPDDAVRPAGQNRNMPAYPIETVQQYLGRLQGAWDAWSLAGTPDGIEAQFKSAGYDGATVYRPAEWTRSEPGGSVSYWSQFWVFIPRESLQTLTADPVEWGEAGVTWGENRVYGSGVDMPAATTMRGIVAKWKPMLWISSVILEGPGETWGTGHEWGEAGLTWTDGTNGRIDI